MKKPRTHYKARPSLSAIKALLAQGWTKGDIARSYCVPRQRIYDLLKGGRKGRL